MAVVGMGKIGLPLAAQYAARGWHVIGVDIQPWVVDMLNEGHVHFAEEPGLAKRISEAHATGRFRATTSHAEATREADVVVIIVPVMLSDVQEPDYRYIDPATESVAAGLHPGVLVLYETTLPVGDTRDRFRPMLEAAGGLACGDPDGGFLVAFSPERVYSGRIFHDLDTYPKLVGGVDAASGARAAAFYRTVVPAEVVAALDRRGRRVRQARGDHLPRRQHRAGQPVRPVRGADGRRHSGGHPRVEQPAVQPHPPARHWGRGATAFPSTRTSWSAAPRSSPSPRSRAR